MATITVEQAKIISANVGLPGRLKLADFLGWEPFDEEEECKKAIHLDCLYNSLLFCVEKGISWPKVCQLFTLTDTMLTQATGLSLTEAVQLYRTQCEKYSSSIDPHSLKTYTDYVFSTFFQHFQLYKYVWNNEQDKNHIAVEAEIEIANDPKPLREGKELDLWEYEEKIRSIETEENKVKTEHSECQKTAEEENSSLLLEKMSDFTTSLEREAMIAFVQDVCKFHTKATSLKIKGNIEEATDDLKFMFQKSIIPRPKVLGPSPFCELKPTIEVRKKTPPKKDKHSAKGSK